VTWESPWGKGRPGWHIEDTAITEVHFVLLAHYKSPIDFSEESLQQAQKSLERIRQAAKIIEKQLETAPEPGTIAPESIDFDQDPSAGDARAKFMESMDNDFNTPYALRAVFNLMREANRRINDKTISRKGLQEVHEQLKEFGEILGISFYATANGPAKKTEPLANIAAIAGLIMSQVTIRGCEIKMRDRLCKNQK